MNSHFTLSSKISGASAALIAAFTGAAAQQAEHHIVPLKDIPSQQWIDIVQGTPDGASQPFVIRIHNDAGYVVLPHTHDEDKNIVVLKGS